MKLNASRTYTGILLGVILVQAAWLAAVPAFRGPDEFDHVYRADGVSHGAILPGREIGELGRGVLTPVRKSVLTAAGPVCAQYRYTRPMNCLPYGTSKGGWAEAASGAGRYNPAYYALVGPVGRLFHGKAVDYAIRVASALMCALLIAWAGSLLTREGGSTWRTIGFAVALTPVFTFSTAIAAPNGLAYSAGLLFWVAGLRLVHHTSVPTRETLAAVSVAAIALANTHTTGPLWLVLIGAFIIALEPRRVRRLLERTDIRFTALFVGLSIAMAAVWIVISSANVPSEPEANNSHIVANEFIANEVVWLLQTIAAFPLRNEPAPTAVYVLWLVPFVALCVAGLTAGTKVRAVVASIAITTVVVATVLTLVSFKEVGYAWQGRYALPIALGLAIVPAFYARGRLSRSSPLFVCMAACMAIASALSVWKVADQAREFVVAPWTHAIPYGPSIAAFVSALGVAMVIVTMNAAGSRAVHTGPEQARRASRERSEAKS